MRRAAIVVIAFALGVAAVPVAGAANGISGLTTCRDQREAGVEPLPGDNCFAGSTQRRAVVAGLLGLASGAAVLAMVVGGIAAFRNSRGIFFALLALIPIALFFAAYGAARV